MVEISVIIPVYNDEKYLDECLTHIINQSFQDIEIICINDGSTDNSLNILNDYQNSDERVRIFTQNNQGLSASRNRGIELAQGKYIYFCDSDDYLELNALKQLYELSEQYGTDFIIFRMNNFNNQTGKSIENEYYTMPYLKKRVENNVFNYNDVSDMALDLAVNVPANFYKKEFIRNMKFPEGLLFEDNVFFTEALFKADKIIFLDKTLYNRRIRTDSLSKSISLDSVDIADLMLDLCKKYNHPNHKKELYYRIFKKTYINYENAPESSKKDLFIKIKNKYNQYSEKWHQDDYFREKLNPGYKNIYESALQSHNNIEFELRVKLNNIDGKIKKIKKQNKKLKNKISKLKKENNEIKSTKGYKIINR